MDDEPLEPLDIDDRSPGERMFDTGHGGLARLGAVVKNHPLDLAALLWMLFTLTIVGAEIYTAARFSVQSFSLGGNVTNVTSDGWEKLQILSTSGGLGLGVACLVGVALAAAFAGATARIAICLAALGGLWMTAAGVLQVAVAHHFSEPLAVSPYQNKLAGSVAGLADAGLGLVVAVVAWWFATSHYYEPLEPEGAAIS